MSPDIYHQVVRDLQELGYEITDWFHKPRYHQHDASAITAIPGATAMSLATIEQGIKNAVDDIVGKVKTFEQDVAPHLSGLADVADQVTQSPLVQTVLAAVLSPEDEQIIVSLVQKLDQGAHALAGQQPAPAEPAQPAQPAA